MCQIPKITSLMARTALHGASYEGSAASSWLKGKVGAGSTGRRSERSGCWGCWTASVVKVYEMNS